jgi:hypothetical protein
LAGGDDESAGGFSEMAGEGMVEKKEFLKMAIFFLKERRVFWPYQVMEGVGGGPVTKRHFLNFIRF